MRRVCGVKAKRMLQMGQRGDEVGGGGVYWRPVRRKVGLGGRRVWKEKFGMVTMMMLWRRRDATTNPVYVFSVAHGKRK
jgi:hypothetical protein